MCIVAHPDDECFAFGGALALAADSGIETYVVCLTDGQAATHRGSSADAEDLGRIRREEFGRSCEVLGVGKYELLEYQDAHLEFADFLGAARMLVQRIRAFRPDVVVTFGSDGALNTHPDHTMVSVITTAAYHWAGWPKRFPEIGEVHRAQRLFHLSTSFFMEARPAPMPLPWNVILDIQAAQDRKEKAFREHGSQAPLIEQTKAMFAEFGRYEYYTLVAQQPPGPMHVMNGLFEGLA